MYKKYYKNTLTILIILYNILILNQFASFQLVQVLHALHDSRQQNESENPSIPIGPDGLPLKTSVCGEIAQSVMRGAEIEKKLANSKVHPHLLSKK